MEWSPQQETALSKVNDWLKGDDQVFYLSGYAGTGKTTLAKEIAGNVSGRVMFGAYTGKAAQVLASKGCSNAQTIHSMIYHIDNPHADRPTFSLNHESEVRGAELLIIDECSMIDEKMGRDLLRFGAKILVLGDPAQLPPIEGQGFFTSEEPDFTLTEIHRQAADNPIIAMSIAVREGNRLQVGTYGESKVIMQRDYSAEEVLKSDQMIIGTHVARRHYNGNLRGHKMFEGETPKVGEKIICLKNDYRFGIFNGTTWIIKAIDKDQSTNRLHRLQIVDFETGLTEKWVSVYQEYFSGQEKHLTPQEKKDTQAFTFGYAITCHKSQGSQWNDVFVYDQSRVFREDANRWLYTALTRAAERVTIMLPE